MKMRMSSPLQHDAIVVALSLILTLTTPFVLVPVVSADENHYCGKNWMAAYTSCSLPCPSGQDSECSSVEPGQTCQGYTGCAAKLAKEQQQQQQQQQQIGEEEEEEIIYTPQPQQPTNKPTRRTKAPRPTKQPTGKPNNTNNNNNNGGLIGGGMLGIGSISTNNNPPIATAISTTKKPTNTNTPASVPTTIEEEATTTTTTNPGMNTNNNINNNNNSPMTSPAAPTTSPIIRPQLQTIDTMTTNPNYTNNNAQQQSTTTATKAKSTILSTTSQKSYGILFDIQTTPSSPILSIVALEFYSPTSNANVAYTVYYRRGTWHGTEGDIKRWNKVAEGNVTTTTATGRTNGYTRLPPTNTNNNNGFFKTPIQLDGNSQRYALMLLLTTKDLLYAHSSSTTIDGSTSTSSTSNAVYNTYESLTKKTQDTLILSKSPELIVYEGAALMTPSFVSAKQPIWYRKPKGFVGRIYYDRGPCEEVLTKVDNVDSSDGVDNGNGNGGNGDDGNGNGGKEEYQYKSVTTWDECEKKTNLQERLPASVGSLPLPLLLNQNNLLGNNNANLEDDDDDGGTLPNNNQGQVQQNESSPYNNSQTQPTQSPSTSDTPTIYTMKIPLILTLAPILSTPRILTLEEQGVFERRIMALYQEYSSIKQVLELNEVELEGVQIVYQQLLFVKEDDDELVDKDGDGQRMRRRQQQQQQQQKREGTRLGKQRWLQLQSQGVEEFVGPQQQQQQPGTAKDGETIGTTPSTTTAPTISSLEVSLVISILYSPLPMQITQDLLATLMMEHKDLLIDLLKQQQSSLPPSTTAIPSAQDVATQQQSPMAGVDVAGVDDAGVTSMAQYFASLTSIPSILTVPKITRPPTLQPTASPTPFVSEVPEEVDTIPGWIITVTIFGVLYLGLLVRGIMYINKSRAVVRQVRLDAALAASGGGVDSSAVQFTMEYEHEHDDDGDGGLKNKSGNKSRKGLLRGLTTRFTSFTHDTSDESSDIKNTNTNDRKGKKKGGRKGNNKLKEQYDAQRELDAAENGGYYSEEEDDEGREYLSSMEESYYSEDDDDEEISENEEEESRSEASQSYDSEEEEEEEEESYSEASQSFYSEEEEEESYDERVV